MYSFIWFACHASGRECVESLEEAKEKFAFYKKISNAYRYEVRLRQTGELVYKG